MKKAPDSHLSYMKHQQPMKALHTSHQTVSSLQSLVSACHCSPVNLGDEGAELLVQDTHADKLRL